MCGRYTLTVSLAAIRDVFPGYQIPDELEPRYNIAPTQPIAVIPNDGNNALDFYMWGLVPSWAKDVKFGSRLINARGETVGEKPSFRSAYKRRRCLVIADGFYEWIPIEGAKKKQPVYVQLKDKMPFAFAGLWEIWQAPDGSELRSATIITTDPNEKIAKLHDRMPVILPRKAYSEWLAEEEKMPKELNHLLKPYPAEKMDWYPVSTLVNSPANDVPETIVPLATDNV